MNNIKQKITTTTVTLAVLGLAIPTASALADSTGHTAHTTSPHPSISLTHHTDASRSAVLRSAELQEQNAEANATAIRENTYKNY
jgi:hypothetical protein